MSMNYFIFPLPQLKNQSKYTQVIMPLKAGANIEDFFELKLNLKAFFKKKIASKF
jgi:hypothetical protein